MGKVDMGPAAAVSRKRAVPLGREGGLLGDYWAEGVDVLAMALGVAWWLRPRYYVVKEW